MKKLLNKSEIRITFTSDAIDWLVKVGYDPQFGARPIKRVIQREVLNSLSKQILAGTISKDSVIEIDREGDELMFRNEPNAVFNMN